MDSWWAGISYDQDSIDKMCQETGFLLIKQEYVSDYALWLWLEK
jgi:hypothetical protein